MGFTVNNASIPLLGSDAAAAHAVTLAVEPHGVNPTVDATAQRTRKALRLLDCCLQLARSNACSGGRWPALCIARDIACRALTYDARVLPCSLVLPHADAVMTSAWKILEEVAGTELTENQCSQAHLPLDLGGIAWPDLMNEVPLARLASIIEMGPHLRAALGSRRPGTDNATISDMDVASRDSELLHRAAQVGVYPGPSGLPAQVAAADPMRPPAPARHLLSAYLRRAGEHRLHELWLCTSAADHTRILSGGGAISGQSLVAPPTTEGVNFTDEEIRTAIRWRLGVQMAAGLCRNEPKIGG